ncbi:hypothetical protein POTOM_010696 [Populus tomentosa]|uniref:Peptide chain release factor domain-containing protein n=1 Tax=Populus tomentosa TaxID=118781 RepID=A0A8X8ADG0_POPTO|nr:hypothetical protein POTOM_010696 [Populus tomentosa]
MRRIHGGGGGFNDVRICSSSSSSSFNLGWKLKFESGIHRVQRVPVTEKSGCVHMSAVSFAILPQADEMLNSVNDIQKYVWCSGVQHANTTKSAVRITHLPTRKTVSIQDEQSQHMNKSKALKVQCAKLYEMERSSIQMSRSRLRSEQASVTYWQQRQIRRHLNIHFLLGDVTDHRSGTTHHAINDVMQGESLDVFIDAFLLQQQMDLFIGRYM